jgi:phage pi2 protein 07
LINSGNTACDLLITYHDAVKFGLQRSSIKIKVGSLTGSVFIVKMLPPLLVSFALRVADEVQEKSASIDAWVMENEMSDADNKEVETVNYLLCDDFFKKVLKANSKGNESVYRASSNYWLFRLSFCLQKSIAASIVNRSKLINGDMLHNPNYQFDEDFILESGFRH